MNKLPLFTIILILATVLTYDVNGQNSPCTAATANIGTSADCSGQLTSSGAWTTAGSGIVDPPASSACLTAANVPGHNYWIKYTVPTGITSMRLQFAGKKNGSGSVRLQDISVQLYTAYSCSGPFTLVGCYNDTDSEVDETVAVTAGNSYYMRVFDADGNSSATSEFNYCINVTHEGDDICDAIPISSFPFSYNSNTSKDGISNYMTGGCNGSNVATIGGGNDLFFSLNVAANSYVKLQLTGTDPSNYSELTVLSTVDCANGPFYCFTNGSWSGGLHAIAPDSSNTPGRTVYFENAGTYYIRIDSDANEGAFTLNADTYTPVAGDACVNAQVLAPNTTVTIDSDNCKYTIGNDDPLPSSLYCAGTVENTNWFYFQSDGSGSNVVVTVSNVSCNTGYYTYIPGPPGPGGYGFYSAQGQFGIVTSSTGACGGSYTSAAACQTVLPNNTYNVTLPNNVQTDYFMIWDGNGGAECKYSINVSNINPLPISLLYFDAHKKDDLVNLNWATASEIDNDYFVVERSKDGETFQGINIIQGAGTSTTENNYNTIDTDPFPGLSYYRLKQVDYNGNFSYSEIKAVDGEEELSFLITPNPVNDSPVNLQLNKMSGSPLNIKISSVTGQTVFEQLITPSKMLIPLEINLSKGLYYVRLQNQSINQIESLLIK